MTFIVAVILDNIWIVTFQDLDTSTELLLLITGLGVNLCQELVDGSIANSDKDSQTHFLRNAILLKFLRFHPGSHLVHLPRAIHEILSRHGQIKGGKSEM